MDFKLLKINIWENCDLRRFFGTVGRTLRRLIRNGCKGNEVRSALLLLGVFFRTALAGCLTSWVGTAVTRHSAFVVTARRAIGVSIFARMDGWVLGTGNDVA